MTTWLSILLNSLISLFRTRRDLAFENLLLRQQLAVLKEKGVRPQLSATDRLFWVLVSKLWSRWRDALHIVKPGEVSEAREALQGLIGKVTIVEEEDSVVAYPELIHNAVYKLVPRTRCPTYSWSLSGSGK